jgi:uncharacterized protein DUF3303
MHYLIIERFKDPVAVYRRFRDQGRMAPDGLTYVSSWITPDLSTCYQVMECEDRRLLDQWVARWSDLIEMEIMPVISSAEAREAIGPRL